MNRIKKRILSCALIVCMTVGMSGSHLGLLDVYAAQNLEDGLIGYWKFDGDTNEEQFENFAPGQSCTMEASGSGVGISQEDSISGGAARFEKKENSFFKLNLLAADQGLNAAAADFSIAAWVKIDSGAGNKVTLFQQTADASNANAQGRTILYYTSDNKFGTYLSGNDIVCAEKAEPGSWNHIVFTCNHATKKAQFYINGRLAEEKTLTGDFLNTSVDLLAGAHKNMAAESAMKGNMDELRYYGKVIDAETVQAIYLEYADGVQVETLKENLRQKVEEAKRLTGGAQEAEAALLQRVQEAEELLADANADAEALTERFAQLEDAMSEYKKTVVMEIAVDTSQEVRSISDVMFGINHRYHNDGYSSWNSVNQEIEPKFHELVQEASFGSIRYPGGTVANLYDWKRAIGPFEQRKKTIHGNTKEPITPNFGVDEAMRWIYDDLDCEAIWVYAMGQGSAQDAADLFEYLNAPADGDQTNPNDGVDWAEVRAKNGHPEPYGVTRFEIGNEMGLWEQNYWMPGCGSSSYASMAGAYVNGGEMKFVKERTVMEEDWRDPSANSDGTAGQVRYARYKYVKEGSASVYVDNEEWEIVDSLAGAGGANVCTFEYETGKITFGDGTNGNIPARGKAITVSYTSMQDGFTAYYDALKAIADELGMEVEVYTCMEQRAAITALQEAGNKYDGAVIHPYSETNANGGSYIYIDENDPEFYEKVLGRSLEHNMTRVRELIDLMGEGKVPVVSEFGIYRHNSQFIRAIGHAVYIANEMIDYINFGTPYLNKHCLVDYPYGSDNLGTGAQCVIQSLENADGTVDFVSTPSAKAFSIFNNMTGNVQVAQTITGNTTYYTFERNGSYEVPVLKAIASKDEDGNTYITVINNRKNDTAHVSLRVDGRDLTNQEANVWYLTSEDVEDENTKENPNHVDVVKTTAVSEGPCLQYTLAPHSITAFQIPPQKMVSITTEAQEGGTVSESVETEAGSSVTVTATPNEGYVFAGWYLGGEKVSEEASYTFVAEESVTVTARFVIKAAPPVPDDGKRPDNPPDNPPGKAEETPGVGGAFTASAENAVCQVLSSEAGKAEVSYIKPANADLTSYVIPDAVTFGGVKYAVTSIAAEAFLNNKKAVSIAIGSGIQTIGKQAFSGCSRIKTVKIGNNVTEIQDKAFYKAVSLTKIVLPSSVKKIGKQAFFGNRKLKNVTIQTEKLTKRTVGKKAFAGIHAKAKFKVPAKKWKVYQKMLRARGAGAKASIRK